MAEEKIETVTIKYYYGTDPDGFYWPGSRQKKQEALASRRNEPSVFESVYQGRPGRRIGHIFLSDDFVFYTPPEHLDAGIGYPAVANFCAKGHGIFQAWDTAFSTSQQSAHSVCITGMFIPCDRFHRGESADIIGDCDAHFDVVILDVKREKLDYGALTDEAKRQNQKWQPRLVLIENRASGISLIQTLPSANVPIQGIDVGSASKGERALNRVDARSAGSVQGWCRMHRVQFPTEAPWLDTFLAELKDFSGENDTSSDQVDAFVHLVTHAIKMSVEGTLFPTGYTLERVDQINDAFAAPSGIADASTVKNVAQFLSYLDYVEVNTFNPYEGTCGACAHYDKGFCNVHTRRVVVLDSCPHYHDESSEGLMLQ